MRKLEGILDHIKNERKEYDEDIQKSIDEFEKNPYASKCYSVRSGAKRGYPTKNDAQGRANYLTELYEWTYNVYYCLSCGKWHVGRAKDNLYTGKRKTRYSKRRTKSRRRRR